MGKVFGLMDIVLYWKNTLLIKFIQKPLQGLEWCHFHILISEHISGFTDNKFVSFVPKFAGVS